MKTIINRNRLLGAISENGFTRDEIAHELNISRNTLNYKLKCIRGFSEEEIIKLIEMFGTRIMNYEEIV